MFKDLYLEEGATSNVPCFLNKQLCSIVLCISSSAKTRFSYFKLSHLPHRSLMSQEDVKQIRFGKLQHCRTKVVSSFVQLCSSRGWPAAPGSQRVAGTPGGKGCQLGPGLDDGTRAPWVRFTSVQPKYFPFKNCKGLQDPRCWMRRKPERKIKRNLVFF